MRLIPVQITTAVIVDKNGQHFIGRPVQLWGRNVTTADNKPIFPMFVAKKTEWIHTYNLQQTRKISKMETDAQTESCVNNAQNFK